MLKTFKFYSMTSNKILKYCLDNLDGVIEVCCWGEQGIFYNPGNVLKRGTYVLTIKDNNGENDRSSGLERDGVFRVNLGLRKQTFRLLFGELPKRPAKGGIIDMPCDFTKLDTIMPHPVYAWMGWICVLNPSAGTFASLKPYILESYECAKEKFNKKCL